MKASTLYRRAAKMIDEHKAHYGCTAIYAIKRGLRELHHPEPEFFQHFDPDALAFTHVFSNRKYHDTLYEGVFGLWSDPKVRAQRVTALCFMAAIMEEQGN